MTDILFPSKTIWWVLSTGNEESPYVWGCTTPEQDTSSSLDIVFESEDENTWRQWLIDNGQDPDNPDF
jgi:hypothetical protein